MCRITRYKYVHLSGEADNTERYNDVREIGI